MRLFQKMDKNYRKKYMYYFGMTFIIPMLVIIVMNMVSQDANLNAVFQFFR